MYLLGLTGLIIGLIVGAFIMKIKIQKLNQKKIFQNNMIEKKINKLNERQQTLENYFNQNINLLNTITSNYQELYQNMIKNSSVLHVHKNIHNKEKLFQHQKQDCKHLVNVNQIKNNQNIIKAPRDYPEDNKNYK